MSSSEDRWLSMNEICEHLGVSNDAVYNWIDKRGMPAYKVGRLWKFKKTSVDDWVMRGGSADSPQTNNDAVKATIHGKSETKPEK